MKDLLYDPHVEGYLEHYGVKGMKWGVRKDQAVGWLRSGTPEQQMGKQIVVSMLVTYGAFKVAGMVTRQGQYAINKALNTRAMRNPEGNGRLRPTGRYRDTDGQYVYLYESKQ